MPTPDLTETLSRIQQRLDLLEKAISEKKSDATTRRRLLTTDEAASFLGMTTDGLRGLTFKKLIPYYKPNGKNMYFDVDELVAWQKKHHFEPLCDKVEEKD